MTIATSASADLSFDDRCKHARCRACDHPGLTAVLDLGHMPPSDGLLHEDTLAQPEPRFALEVAFCPSCSLMQILETLPPEQLFGERYAYYSSFSDALLNHSRKNAENLIRNRRLDEQSFVVELASNDGYLLRNFVAAGIPVLGIDPAPGQAKAANAAGVPTQCAFFTEELARTLAGQGKRADVIIANNVLAHVADTNGFVRGIATLLKPNGVAVIEVPYVRELIAHCEFDTIYHEHLCYFSVHALEHLFERHGLHLNDVERLNIHGGSLRLYVQHKANPTAAVTRMKAEEKADGMTRAAFYADFAHRARELRESLCQLLTQLKERGCTIAAYGAAAKGTILLNYLGVGAETIDFVADRNVHKHGKWMPGARIPVVAAEALRERQPDYTLLLTWNFKDEVLEQQAAYRAAGGRFIIPVPRVAVV